MAYKISGYATDDSRAHIIKDGEYIGYRDVSSGDYALIFDAPDNANIMTAAEKNDGETTGFGKILGISTGDSPNLTMVGGASLKSIGFGTISMIQGETSKNLTIPEVDLTKTILIPTGQTWPGAAINPENRAGMLELTDSTTVSTYRSGIVETLTINFQIIEFNSGVSVQRGSTNATYTTTISPVVVANSIVIITGYWLRAIGETGRPNNIHLSDSTTITAGGGWYNPGNNSGGKVSWDLLEFI